MEDLVNKLYKDGRIYYKVICSKCKEERLVRNDHYKGIESLCNKCSTSKHGYYNTRVYHIWQDIKKRCYNKNSRRYKNYGGKGIIMQRDWLNPKIFIEWALRNGYTDLKEIHRINSNKGYNSINCIWLTKEEHWKETGKERGKIVSQYTMNGDLIKTYISTAEAHRQTGINNIRACASGRLKTAGGYKWIYS